MEVRIRGKSGPGTGSVMQMEIKVGVVTKTTFVAQKMRQMMTAGPPSAAEHQLPHPFGLIMIPICQFAKVVTEWAPDYHVRCSFEINVCRQ